MDDYDRGAASSSRCPREGSVLLADWKGGIVIVNTNCNSWRCLGCRDRNLRRFKATVRTGLSTLERSAFITITYKAGAVRLSVAGCVARDWKALWRRLRRVAPDLTGLPMLRVMELTKRGTPHFHLVLGNVPKSRRLRCYGTSFNVERFKLLMRDCMCVSHELARAWSRVQDGESWIVHVVPITSARGAAAYTAKYMLKGFDVERMRSLGMTRRWSASRNWPSAKRVRLETSVVGPGWRRRRWSPGQTELDKALVSGFGEDAQKKRGTPQQFEELARDAAKRLIRTAEGMVGDD